ncbi:hypothetical protein [Micromonospora sp. NPDC004551]|uniref:hypothetical protein n=1 Tax=Micromonospora sp. NPDC004551 TaxID=3154284 RepID=UPI0033B2EBF5
MTEQPTYKTSPCGSCQRQVIWTVTENNKRMPVDPQPTPDGSVALTADGADVRSRVVEAKFRFGRKDLHRSHFANCPNAAQHRRTRRGGRGGRRG